MQLFDTFDFRQRCLHLLRFAAENLQVRAKDAHDKGVGRPCQHLSHPLFEIGLHVARDPRVAVNCLPNSGQRLVIVDRRVDADPVLTEVDTVNLIRQQGLSDMGAAVADPRDFPQLIAGFN